MENSSIAWTTHTFNCWIGCQHATYIGEDGKEHAHQGCLMCYAEADFDKRRHKVKWGPNGTRVKTSEAYWKQPLKWNRDGQGTCDVCLNGRPRVFCASLADVFEDWQGDILDHQGRRLWVNRKDPSGVDGYMHESAGYSFAHCRPTRLDDLRRDLFALIDATPNLDWILLTKRPENIRRMIESCGSIGYNGGYDKNSGTIRVSGDSVGRVGNRPRGASLETNETARGSVDGGNSNDSVQAGSRGDGERIGLSASSVDEGRQEDLRLGASPCVDSLQRANSGRPDDKSQGREQRQQSSEQSGSGDIQRTEAPRDKGSRGKARRLQGLEAPQDEADGSGRVKNPRPSRQGVAGEGTGRSVRNADSRDQRDLLPPHLDPRSVSQFYRPNLWLVCSISDQATADAAIPELLKCRDLCPVLGVSYEPALGPCDFSRWLVAWERPATLDWLIVGGESGPHARPFNVAWARSTIKQCRAAGVAVFCKQLGSVPVEAMGVGLFLKDRKGGDMSEWPEDLRVREFPRTEQQ